MSMWSGKIDMKDIAIIDAFPIYDCPKTVLSVGCGKGGIDYNLANMGYRVYATDIVIGPQKNERPPNLTFHLAGIFDLMGFPIKSSPIVICSQVLEHLKEYKLALVNLLALTEIRLIITVPWRRSFYMLGHINFWDDKASGEFKDIHEFVELCKPYKTTVSKILTKPRDAGRQYNYLIVVDKRQKLSGRAR